jgi:uroporphyrin-III C-methyltransferase
MARDAARAAADRLIAQGRSPRTPAVAVENAGAPHARVIAATLETLPAALADAACSGPVVLVIGEAAGQVRLPLEASVLQARSN